MIHATTSFTKAQSFSSHASQGTRIIYPDPARPVKLGRGFDTIRHSLAGDGVIDTPTFQTPGTNYASGQLIVFRMVEIKSMSDLTQALEINAAVSFSGLFGVSVGARSSCITSRCSLPALRIWQQKQIDPGETETAGATPSHQVEVDDPRNPRYNLNRGLAVGEWGPLLADGGIARKRALILVRRTAAFGQKRPSMTTASFSA